MIEESCHRINDFQITAISSGWLSPSLIGCRSLTKGGFAVVAQKPVARGEILVIFGGTVIHEELLKNLDASWIRLSLQIDESLFIVSTIEGPADWINHSCNPNAGFRGQISLVAMRDIETGEEICYDYAMSDGSPYDEFECKCGSDRCRGRVTGDDWKIQELWNRYGEYFSTYLQYRMKNKK